MYSKTLELNFTEYVGTIEISDEAERFGVALQYGECDSLAAAIEQGVNYWIDDDKRQIGFSNLIVYISAEFIVLGVDKSKELAGALRGRSSLKVEGT